MGRILGIGLIIGGLFVAIILSVLMFVYVGEGSLSRGAAVLGFAIGFIVLVLPQWGVGGFMLWKGGQDMAADARADQQRKLLNIVKTRGQVDIGDLVIEMQSDRDSVKQMLHDLVGMGLFSGYVNWDEGVLYSQEAGQLRDLTRCRHCDGEVELAGKGVIRCPYCGTEYFLE